MCRRGRVIVTTLSLQHVSSHIICVACKQICQRKTHICSEKNRWDWAQISFSNGAIGWVPVLRSPSVPSVAPDQIQLALPKAPLEEPNIPNPPILLQQSNAAILSDPELGSLVDALEIDEMAKKVTPDVVQCVLANCVGCQNGGSIISLHHTDEMGVIIPSNVVINVMWHFISFLCS